MPLTSEGYTAKTLSEILDEIETEQRALWASVDISTSSPLGQNNRIYSRQLRKVYEAQAALYAAMNPNGASGRQLDILSALTGTERREATFSNVEATVNVDPGTYVAGSLVAQVSSNPSVKFENAEDVVNGGGAAANIAATFVAQEAGPVQAPSGTLEISGAVSGWNSITNAADATIGEDTETDPELRIRRAAEVQAQGSTTVDAIRADISQNIDGVISVVVVENDTGATVDGIPPHAFETIVYGPTSPTAADDQEVADQIFASKPAGVQAYGTTTESVTDTQGVAHPIGFTRPTVLDAEIDVTGQVASLVGLDLAGLKTEIAERAQEVLLVGDDLDWSEVVSWCFDLIPGLLRVTAVEVGPQGGPLVAYGTEVATIREIIALASGDITLTLTEGTP